MNKTTFEKGIEQGFQEGMAMGVQIFILRIGRKRFGPPPHEIETAIRAIENLPHLDELADKVLEVASWIDLLQTPGN